MIDTVWGSTKKPVSARQLAEALSGIADLTGTLYIGYPIIGTPEGAFPFDALLLSPEKGAVAFDLVEGLDIFPRAPRRSFREASFKADAIPCACSASGACATN